MVIVQLLYDAQNVTLPRRRNGNGLSRSACTHRCHDFALACGHARDIAPGMPPSSRRSDGFIGGLPGQYVRTAAGFITCVNGQAPVFGHCPGSAADT